MSSCYQGSHWNSHTPTISVLNWLQANEMFWEVGLFSSSGGSGGEAAAQLGLTEIALLDQWATCVIFHLLYMHIGLHFLHGRWCKVCSKSCEFHEGLKLR
jgi:hypothetical protein